MAITITPKYKPFTYDELVKPLEGYWKDYDKAEEDLVKLETDTAVLQSVIDSMPEGEEKTKYTNYLSSLNSQAEALASQGLTRDNRNALRNIKTQYSALIPRLSLAEEVRRKDLALYTQRANSGEYFMDSGNSPLNKSVIDYLDGNVPLYNNGINKKTLGTDVEGVAKAYSNRIFPETNIEEVEKIKNKFIKVTQEQGVNADFSQVEGNEQFMPILNALYEQYGIDKMTGEEQAAAKDFVNRKFWEGLVYKKAEDYQKNVVPRSPKDPSQIIDLRMTDSQGNRLVKVGGQIVAITGENPDGSFIVDKWTATKPGSTSQQQKENERKAFESTFVGGYDSWRDNTVYNRSWIGRHIVGDIDENRIQLPSEIVTMYVKNILNSKEDIDRSDATVLISPANMSTAFEKSRKNFSESTSKEIAKYNMSEKDMVGFHIGGDANTQNSSLKRRYSEWFGDNHIRLLPAQSVIDQIADKPVAQQITLLKNIRDIYNDTNTNTPYKIVELADNRMAQLLKDQLDTVFIVDQTGNVQVANGETLEATLQQYSKAFGVDAIQAFNMAYGKNVGDIAYKAYTKYKNDKEEALLADVKTYQQLSKELEQLEEKLKLPGSDSLSVNTLKSQQEDIKKRINSLKENLAKQGYRIDPQSGTLVSLSSVPDVSTF